MNMVRIPGGTAYEDEALFSLCDRLGLMVWQDAMFAFLDPPMIRSSWPGWLRS